MDCAHYSEMAGLFDFPGPGFAARGAGLLDFLRQNHPEAALELEQFLDAIPASVADLQELHTRTFEVQALTTLDIGYVLFGDDYKRGALLSRLNQEHRRLENDCRGELADYLPNLLRLIPRLEDPDMLRELVGQLLVPALMLMIREFDPERIENKNANYRKHYRTLIDPARAGDPAIYRRLLKAALQVLEKDFQVTDTVAMLSACSTRPQSVDFLRLVERELVIERDANPVNSGCDA